MFRFLSETDTTGPILILKTLLDAGAEVNARGRVTDESWRELLPNAAFVAQTTPLHLAAAIAPPAVVKVLLNAGALVNARNYNKETPMHFAAGRGNPVKVEALLLGGGLVNARDAFRQTPLHWAKRSMNRTEGSIKPFLEVIEILKAHGARE